MDLKKNCDFKVIIAYSNKKNSRYYSLVADLGYTKKYLSFNIAEIAEICGISTKDLVELENGEYII